MTISSILASPDLYADLSAVSGTAGIYVATLCEIGANPQSRLTVTTLPMFPALVLELRGYGGTLSSIYTLDDIQEDDYNAIGDGRILTVLLSSPPVNPDAGFCLMHPLLSLHNDES